MADRTDRAARRRMSARIIRRDGGICHLCGNAGADSIDHLLPASRGGTNAPHNLAAAHLHCNKVRGNRSITAARADLQDRQREQHGWDW